jgi:DNA-binding response OmpR family regulator
MDMMVLVVEDEPFTAMALELELVQAGHQVVGPAATVAEARALARDRRPGLAVVDINLHGGGDTVALAHELTRSGVPTLFASGQVATARRHAEAAWGLIAKPYDSQVVLRALEIVDRLARGEPASSPPAGLELFEQGRAALAHSHH